MNNIEAQYTYDQDKMIQYVQDKLMLHGISVSKDALALAYEYEFLYLMEHDIVEFKQVN